MSTPSQERKAEPDYINNSGVTAHEKPPASATDTGLGEAGLKADDVGSGGAVAMSPAALDRFDKTRCLDFMTEWRRCICESSVCV